MALAKKFRLGDSLKRYAKAKARPEGENISGAGRLGRLIRRKFKARKAARQKTPLFTPESLGRRFPRFWPRMRETKF